MPGQTGDAKAAPMTLQQTRAKRQSGKKPAPVPPLVGNQKFKVFFGSTQINFARVSNVQRSVEHEDLLEGGLNDYVHVLTKPGGQSGTLTLERGGGRQLPDQAHAGTEPGTRITTPVTILLYYRDASGWKPARAWGFEDGMVTRWELGNLDGLGSEVIIEKLEISHAGLTEQEV